MDRILDSTKKGNIARFINHSCDPNCQLQRVNVAGVTRIAIVCIREVAAGEFLSYDYQFDTEKAEKFRCACGASKCRGSMKGGKTNLNGVGEEVQKKTKSQALKDAKAKNERDRLYVAKIQEESAPRLNFVGSMVPGGDAVAEVVLNGPRDMMVPFFRESRIALWRNVIAGYKGLLRKGKEATGR
jgi:hypothetical protein